MKEEQEILAKKLNLGFTTELLHFPLIVAKSQKIPYAFAKKNLTLALEEKKDSILVAVYDPLHYEALEELRFLLEKQIEIIVAPKDLIESAIELCYQVTAEETKKLFNPSKKQLQNAEIANENIEGYDLLERSEKNPIIGVLNAIIVEAIQQNASDIHFEPQEKDLLIRYRIDGVLFARRSPPSEYQMNILMRLKVMAKLDIAERRLPQDGRMKLKMGKREIDFRVSTIPVVHGERIVLRILDKGNIVLGLDHLGMPDAILSSFKKLIRLSEGIILVTGPTGSGKTTTLYSVISEISSSETNIMTIEDPVEYKLANIAQIGVNPKIQLTFAKGLRHILRQDPDVIMIGEIRDSETAQIAIQASLTGHLVFSTLHTNDAPSAITRLADMGVEPYLLSSSIIGILAQRLVRRICLHCKESYIPDSSELSQLYLQREDLPKGCLYRGQGCSHCSHTGYLGRHGVYELVKMHAGMRGQIIKSVDAEELRKIAKIHGYQDLFSSGKELLIAGITTTFELLRVISNLQNEES